MKNYRLYNMYDYFGIYLSKECDSECSIFICKRNPETGTFLADDAEPLDYEVY